MSDTTELLNSLRDIHEPIPPQSVSPLWMLLVFVLCIGVIGLLLIRIAKARRVKPSPWIEQITIARTEEPEQARLRLARLLRHICLNRGDDHFETLSGQAWLEHLDKVFFTRFFTTDAGIAFGDDLYAPVSKNFSINVLCDELEKIVKNYSQKATAITQASPTHPSAQQAQS